MELTSTVSNLPSVKRAGNGFHLSRLKSLVHKNWIQLMRHPGGIFFSLLFPIIDLLAFYAAVGGDLHDIKVAVVNNESNWSDCQNYLAHYSTASYEPANDTCQMNLLSCRFLNSFNDSFLTKEFYPDLESAIGAVRQGNVVGAMYFNHNYTESLSSRTNDGRSASDIDIDNSAINMWMDMSNRQIAWVIQYNLIDRYIDFAKDVIKDCNQDVKQAELPIHIYEPIYGTKNEKFSVFMTPGMMLTINFFMATLLTSTVLVTDRLEGIWDRTVVAGCTTLEILLSHSITQLSIAAMQSIEIVIIVFIVVGVNCIGNYFTVILLLLLQGIAGITYGFLISVYSGTSTTSLYLSTASFYPMLFLSGVLWPVEGMPYVLQQFAQILPFTIPITSVRNVMTRGWAITNIAVFNGYLITVAWVIVFCIVSFFKLSKNT